MQSEWVAARLVELHPSLRIQTVVIKTTGDRVTDRPLAEIGGKGNFTKEIEQALIDGQIDVAVHSLKDLPVTMPLVDTSKLVVAAVPVREDARDAILFRDPGRTSLAPGSVVGTSSLRRQVQIAESSPDVTFKPLRGNIDTRIRKLRGGEFDAIVLAMAGLNRAGLYDASFMVPIEPDVVVPAAGQGALAVECRVDDPKTAGLLFGLHDRATGACVSAETDLVQHLGGDCESPIGVLATITAEGLFMMRAAVGGRGGKLPVMRVEATGHLAGRKAVIANIAQQLESQGVHAHLREGQT